MSELAVTVKDMRRFWAKVSFQPDGCWLWQGHLTSDKGNGSRLPQFHLRGQKVGARRLSYLFHLGVPPGRIGVSCGNPLCVSPQHLMPAADAKKSLGVAHTRTPTRRIDDKVARRIVRLRKAGRTTPAIAASTGVSQGQVCTILCVAGFCEQGLLDPSKDRKRK